jgi:PUA domain protein
MSLRKELGSKQKKEILLSIQAPGVSKSKIKANIQFILNDTKKGITYLFDKNQYISFFSYENEYLPSLKFIRKYPEVDFPSVQVDEGAVKFIINGADVFTQGIVSCNKEFSENTIILILNPQNSALGLGKSLMSSKNLLSSKGKGILNIHYLNDKIWNEEI